MRIRAMEIDGLDCEIEETVELELDDETYAMLERMAKDRGITVDDLVQEALETMLDKDPEPFI